MTHIVSYSCQTAAGRGPTALIDALFSQRSYCVAKRGLAVKGAFATRDLSLSVSDHAVDLLKDLYKESVAKTPWRVSPQRTGVVFATTKGATEDYIWNERTSTFIDPLYQILTAWIEAVDFYPAFQQVVSHACSSSHIALGIAKSWFDLGLVDHCIVLSFDEIGRFISQGFSALQALGRQAKPFSAARDGLMLGDGAACVLLSRNDPAPHTLKSFRTFTEAHAATRTGGEGLKHCLTNKPDLVIAHGTGTRINDETEDQVYAEVFGDDVPVTGTKWCIGHTMASSGLLDVIVACEILKRQEVFPLPYSVDPKFKARYVSSRERMPIKNVLVSSLGFGGVQATCLVSSDATIDSRSVKQACSVVEEEIQIIESATPPATVDRWNQLDEASRALALAAVTQLKPDGIILASPEGSLATDFAFAQTGAVSPSKFVHTLPSVRSLALCQALQWEGPVICLQNGHNYWEKALDVAAQLGFKCVHVYSYHSRYYAQKSYPIVRFAQVKMAES